MSTGANVTLALAVTVGGAVLAWTGFTNPPGGLAGAVQRIINGQPAAPARVAGSSSVLDLVPALYTPSTPAAGTGGAVTAGYTTGGGGQAAIVAEARKYIGKPYAWGGNGPAAYDCSGLTVKVFKAFGVTLPRVTTGQELQGTAVPMDQVQPGDLIFMGRPAFHVGIATGGGKFIDAPHTGGYVSERSYSWGSQLHARRITVAAPTAAAPPKVTYTA